jgi:hypothetical protein
VRLTGPAVGQDGAAVPCAVLISRAGDAGLTMVARLLGKVGIRALRIDAQALPALPVLVDPAARTLQVGALLVRPTVTWVRHFSSLAIRTDASGAAATFAQDSWDALISQIHHASARAVPSWQPGLLDQLALAGRLGIAVPRTVAVTDIRQANSLINSPRAVIKALGSHFAESPAGTLTGVFPEIVPRHWLDAGWGLPGPPVVIQEYIDHDTELRVYYVQGDMHSFRISKESPAALWVAQDSVQATPVETPGAVRSATSQIASALHLEYAAFDFLVRQSTPIFLEANVAGDWAWVERLTGTASVTTAVARMLRDLHLRASSGAGYGPGAPSARLDLLRFLALRRSGDLHLEAVSSWPEGLIAARHNTRDDGPQKSPRERIPWGNDRRALHMPSP